MYPKLYRKKLDALKLLYKVKIERCALDLAVCLLGLFARKVSVTSAETIGGQRVKS